MIVLQRQETSHALLRGPSCPRDYDCWKPSFTLTMPGAGTGCPCLCAGIWHHLHEPSANALLMDEGQGRNAEASRIPGSYDGDFGALRDARRQTQTPAALALQSSRRTCWVPVDSSNPHSSFRSSRTATIFLKEQCHSRKESKRITRIRAQSRG